MMMWSLTARMPKPISSPLCASVAMCSGVAMGPRDGRLKPNSMDVSLLWGGANGVMDAARQGAAAAGSARDTSGRWQPAPAYLSPVRDVLCPSWWSLGLQRHVSHQHPERGRCVLLRPCGRLHARSPPRSQRTALGDQRVSRPMQPGVSLSTSMPRRSSVMGGGASRHPDPTSQADDGIEASLNLSAFVDGCS